MSNYFDIYNVGVGGQGILTISDIITEGAAEKGIGINFYPAKGMSQRGGFVRSQLRLGREAGAYSPSIAPGGADLIISMELSETLKAIRYGKQGADYVILGNRWLPTNVMLGKAPYPTADIVKEQIRAAGGKVHYLDPEKMPTGMRGNIYLLGAVCAHSRLLEFLSKDYVEEILAKKWPKKADSNLAEFRAGFAAQVEE
ncbi:2-oxoacid:acceptor oxidoreductase family protein [Synergistes jonesii]|uniref:2-oxoacid:acceptor oxidoreductase family protein n=1 Tax=Synergistes jonesii TaxID=2754 RepID=UPI00248E4427|nr:2-oxoacid:acceptor oxidoreductase family protein [Synergistes jonesii]